MNHTHNGNGQHLTAVVAEVRAVLVDRGLDFFAPIPITQLTAGLELFDAEQLQEAELVQGEGPASKKAKK
jgi:hypothetical protein